MHPSWSCWPVLSKRFFGFIALVVCPLSVMAAPGGVTAPDSAPLEILSRMAVAGETLAYRGIFTYEHGGVMKSVKVRQQSSASGSIQHLLYLNGPRREIVRSSSTAKSCPQVGEVSLPALLGRSVVSLEDTARHYDIVQRNDDRVADRPIWVYQFVPKDTYRYGYVLGVDQRTGVLLQTLLIGSNNRVLERFQFVAFSETSGEQEPQPQPDVIQQAVAEDCTFRLDQRADVSWQAVWLPPGFRLIEAGVDRQGLEVGVYSDGLSVFSIFVDGKDGQHIPEVQAQRGATVVQLNQIASGNRVYAVSVVGEIPMEGAQRIASQVRIKEP